MIPVRKVCVFFKQQVYMEETVVSLCAHMGAALLQYYNLRH